MPARGTRRHSKRVVRKEPSPDDEWALIRSGLRRQSIQQQLQMTELKQVAVSVEFSKLLMQRHIGLGSIVPNAEKWRIDTEQRDECWHCGQYVLTIFLWSPQIDASKQDEDMVMYYRRMIEAETGNKGLRRRNSKLSKDETCTPMLRAPFTNWSAV